MIDGKEYIEIVKEYYSFLVTEFNFSVINEKIRGNVFYDVQYRNEKKMVSVSYENIEDYFQAIVFILENGELPDYDDKTKTLHLNQLNKVVLSKISKNEIVLNNEHFLRFQTKSEIEKKLLKSAKELRLCLKYWVMLQTC